MLPIKSFNPEHFIKAAECLLAADETLMALDLLEMLPSYYKDHPVKEIEELKKEIKSKIATASFYATHKGFELTIDDQTCMMMDKTLRSQMVAQDVRLFNEAGFTPHVIDHAPGEGALPLILKGKGFKFTYEQVYVNHPTYEASRHRFSDIEKPWDKTSPLIWVSTEVIEHLHREDEIRFDMEQKLHPHLPDVIHVSTPLYTFNPNVENWRDIGWLGHLRTYSPKMLQEVVAKMFPEFVWAYYKSQVQHIRLVNPATKYEQCKIHYQVES